MFFMVMLLSFFFVPFVLFLVSAVACPLSHGAFREPLNEKPLRGAPQVDGERPCRPRISLIFIQMIGSQSDPPTRLKTMIGSEPIRMP